MMAMKEIARTIKGRRCFFFLEEKEAPAVVLIGFEEEVRPVYSAIKERYGGSFHLIAVCPSSWNDDLTPWKAKAVFKGPDFGGKADEFLSVLDAVIAELKDVPVSSLAIAGYSLAGLFAVYAAYKRDCFDAVLSGSGSFWYPDFVSFCKANGLSSKLSYVAFSLGKKEPNAKGMMSVVGEKTQELVGILTDSGIQTSFVWNEGGHFAEPDKRMSDLIISFLLSVRA